MVQYFIPYEPKQTLLFPPSIDDWLPEDHLARFISDTVDELDIGAFLKKYEEREDGRGRVAYHPRMMLKILIYAYSVGIFSSRKIAKGLEDLVALRYLAAGQSPSHRTIARFRQEYLGEFQALFVQVVRIAVGAGLVKMGTLAIDGTKVKANASKHKAMSYGRMKSEEERLREEIRQITRLAQETDVAEDEQFGPDFRGDELPQELRRREERLKRIREAKARLEQEAAEKAGEGAEDDDDRRGGGRSKPGGKKPVVPDKKQMNFTDPESRIMGNPRVGFLQGYNAQIAVDAEDRLIVAAEVTQNASDCGQLLPMIEAAERNTELGVRRVLADSGYKLESDLLELEKRGVDAHVALGKGEGQAKRVPTKPATRRMHRKRQTKRSRALYKKRKHIAEPPFGWIKSVLGFKSFSLRGLQKVIGEWHLVCLALNLRRMAQRLVWT